MKTFKWGILGTSFISEVMANAITQNNDGSIVAVAGRSQAPLRQLAEKHCVPHVYLDYQSVIDNPEVDIVYIALPNHLHVEWVIKAANAGKAVLCEKSLSIDVASANRAIGVVRESNVFFAEGLMYLHHPLIAKLHEVIKQSTLGKLKSIQGSYCAAISAFTNPAGKGVLFNLGCYPMSLAISALSAAGVDTSNIELLNAIGRKGDDDNIVETTGVFSSAQGHNITLHCAEDYGLRASFALLFEQGFIEFETNPWLPTHNNVINVSVYEQTPQRIEVGALGDGFDYQVEHVHQALNTSSYEFAAPLPTYEHSLSVMKQLEDWASQMRIIQ